MNPHYADGLDEARRGLFRSAAESFSLAVAQEPTDPTPVLAAAACWLALHQPERALILLETSPATRELPLAFAKAHAWLVASARLAAGDPLGAIQVAKRLPPLPARRVRVAALLAAEEWSLAVDALLAGRR